MRGGLLLVLACGTAPEADLRVPVTKTGMSSTVTSSGVATGTTTGSTTTPAVWGGCACPETYAPEAWNTWHEGNELIARPLDRPMRDQLVLFLHGTGQSPSNHERVLRTVDHAGFPAIAVDYPTNIGVDWCKDNVSADDLSMCVEEMRLARIYGAEHPLFLDVTDEGSIVGRLTTALVAAEATDPDGPWDSFLDASPADVTNHEAYLHWDRILLVGFSQGAAHLALLARDVDAAGLMMLSAPVDERVDWVNDPRATAACKTLGFHHKREDFTGYIEANFERFGLGAEGTDIAPLPDGACDGMAWPPLGGHHWLYSDLPANQDNCVSEDGLHGSMGNDSCMNLDDAVGDDPYALFRTYLGALCWLGDGGDCPS